MQRDQGRREIERERQTDRCRERRIRQPLRDQGETEKQNLGDREK